MYNNIILIPPCNTYGDIMSIIAMLYYLLNYYSNVYLFLHLDQPLIIKYYYNFFKCDSANIFIITNENTINMLNSNDYDFFHICNTHTGDWKHNKNNYTLFENININKKHYFCDSNPLYNVLNISEEYSCIPNVSLPLNLLEINSIVYYKMVGLNNNVRMNYFNYIRDIEKESVTKFEILTKFNIKLGDKYNIINTLSSNDEDIKKRINNNYTTIDINYLVEFPGWLLTLIEDSEEIHLVEGCNVNFIYYCQYNNIINLKHVYFHIWARNRNWSDYNLDYSWKMMNNPKLQNWNFIFE
jgi:hypothetical protein